MTPVDPGDGFVADVLSLTSGPACGRARRLLAGVPDDPMSHADSALVEHHVRHCPACRGLAELLPRLALELPALANESPDGGFTARVLALTTGRPRPRPWRARWVSWWNAAVTRPRFAWEAAYALTLVLVLIVGDPVRAWDSAASRFPTLRPHVLDTRLPAPASVARVERVMTSRIDAAYTWLERRTEAAGMLLTTLRGHEAARSSAWYTVVDTTSRWARRALAWARPLVDAFRAPSTEPATDPVRSSDHRETNR